MKKLNILITGGTGFVGKNLIKSLKNKNYHNYSIEVLSRKESLGFIKGDLTDYNSIKNVFDKIDIVVHLAYSKNYPENLVMAKNLINASRKAKIKKIILLSSMSAKRTHPDAYGKNKSEIEKMIVSSGLNYTILRPSIIYGKGSTSFDFMINYMKKIPFFVPIIGSGMYCLYPVHINDVVSSIIKCMNNHKTDKKDYDLPGREKIYFIDLINLLKKEKSIRKPNIHIPLFMANIVAAIFPFVISRENIKNLTENSLADIKKAEKDFGYNPKTFKKGAKHGII